MRGPWVPPWIEPLPSRAEKAGRILFLSDLHFGAGPDDGIRRQDFAAALAELPGNVDDLVLGGDAFEFWWEWRHAIPSGFMDVLLPLREVSRAGVRVRFLRGNHDFALGPALESFAGGRVLPDGICLESEGRRWLLVHGDAAPASERIDRLVRRVLRSGWAQTCWNLLPPDLSFGIALGVGKASRWAEPGPAPSTVEMETMARLWMDRFGLAGVVHGHTHRPLLTRGTGGTYVNNGDWILRRDAVWIQGDRAEAVDFLGKERPWASNT